MRPSAAARAITLVSSAAERMASSLPGIGKSTSSGSQLVSRIDDDRDAQLAGLADGDVLLLGVDDPDRARDLGHVADAAEGLLELVLLTGEHEDLLLGATLEATRLLHRLQLLEALKPLVHGLEVGEHAAQPALVDVRHVDAARLVGDGLLRLLLRADEHDRAAVGDGLADELVGPVDVGQGLLQVDDVDAVALGEDVALHLRVPAAGLVPEVHTGVQQLLHGDDGHGRCSPLVRAWSLGGHARGFAERRSAAPPWRRAGVRTRQRLEPAARDRPSTVPAPQPETGRAQRGARAREVTPATAEAQVECTPNPRTPRRRVPTCPHHPSPIHSLGIPPPHHPSSRHSSTHGRAPTPAGASGGARTGDEAGTSTAATGSRAGAAGAVAGARNSRAADVGGRAGRAGGRARVRVGGGGGRGWGGGGGGRAEGDPRGGTGAGRRRGGSLSQPARAAQPGGGCGGDAHGGAGGGARERARRERTRTSLWLGIAGTRQCGRP